MAEDDRSRPEYPGLHPYLIYVSEYPEEGNFGVVWDWTPDEACAQLREAIPPYPPDEEEELSAYSMSLVDWDAMAEYDDD